MLSLLFTFSLSHAYSLFEDPDFLRSNCRFQSAVHPFASAITSKDQKRCAVDLQKEECETQQRLAILANVTDAGGVTLMSDSGIVEFREPGRTGALTECFYTVKQGVPVPKLILEMNGTIKGRQRFWPEDILKIKHEAKRIVRVTCGALTS